MPTFILPLLLLSLFLPSTLTQSTWTPDQGPGNYSPSAGTLVTIGPASPTPPSQPKNPTVLAAANHPAPKSPVSDLSCTTYEFTGCKGGSAAHEKMMYGLNVPSTNMNSVMCNRDLNGDEQLDFSSVGAGKRELGKDWGNCNLFGFSAPSGVGKCWDYPKRADCVRVIQKK